DFERWGAAQRSNLAAISKSSGKPLGWRVDMATQVNAIVLADHSLYVGTDNGFYSLSVDGGVIQSFPISGQRRVEVLAVAGSNVIAGGSFNTLSTGSHSVAAFD